MPCKPARSSCKSQRTIDKKRSLSPRLDEEEAIEPGSEANRTRSIGFCARFAASPSAETATRIDADILQFAKIILPMCLAILADGSSHA